MTVTKCDRCKQEVSYSEGVYRQEMWIPSWNDKLDQEFCSACWKFLGKLNEEFLKIHEN